MIQLSDPAQVSIDEVTVDTSSIASIHTREGTITAPNDPVDRRSLAERITEQAELGFDKSALTDISTQTIKQLLWQLNIELSRREHEHTNTNEGRSAI